MPYKKKFYKKSRIKKYYKKQCYKKITDPNVSYSCSLHNIECELLLFTAQFSVLNESHHYFCTHNTDNSILAKPYSFNSPWFSLLSFLALNNLTYDCSALTPALLLSSALIILLSAVHTKCSQEQTGQCK